MASCSEFSHWLKKMLLAQAGLPPCSSLPDESSQTSWDHVTSTCAPEARIPVIGADAVAGPWEKQPVSIYGTSRLQSPHRPRCSIPRLPTVCHSAPPRHTGLVPPPASSPMSFPLAWNTSNHTTRSPSLQVLPVNFIKKSIEKIKVTLKKRILLRA